MGQEQQGPYPGTGMAVTVLGTSIRAVLQISSEAKHSHPDVLVHSGLWPQHCLDFVEAEGTLGRKSGILK